MLMFNYHHSYHLVDVSPWPLMGAVGVFFLVVGLVEWFSLSKSFLIFLSIFFMFLVVIQWWRDVIRESSFQGFHSLKVLDGMRFGMIMFIISEVFFFFSFFWGFFYSSLSPTIELGYFWPPSGVFSFNFLQIPLLNTVVLLSSGVTITWSHYALLESDYFQTVQGMILTVILGIYFILLQVLEYWESSFTISDSIYGSSFFMATGFHGLHVMIGMFFIMIMALRLMKFHFSSVHHFGFEASIWYWHFVDVVWLFLFVSIYWWGN